MRKYPNEAAFSKHLCDHLTSLGYFVQRIETRLTGRGVPDVYVGTPTDCYWIELKRAKYPLGKSQLFVVDWRPGQQRWAYQHYKHTDKPCFTFVAFDDVIVCIPIVKMFRGNVVNRRDIIKVWIKVEDVRL